MEKLNEDAPVVIGKELPAPQLRDVDRAHDGTGDAIWPLSDRIAVMWVGPDPGGRATTALLIEASERNILIPCQMEDARKLALALLAATLYDPEA